jgi:hypothetical protein
MKMVKGLLLGSAAGIVAVAGAQAADLPVKAKAVEYVKICSLYGAGFYYMPGTNLCIKIGGYVRNQHYWNYGSTGTASNFTGVGSNNSRSNAGDHDYIIRSRTILTADVRHQSEYGTIRAYMNIGHSADSPGAAALYANRAFLQFAGFTLGKASSYFDFYSSPAVAYLAAHPGSDTGDGGWHVAAYTAQFGNGFSATLSIEEPRRTAIWNSSVVSGGVSQSFVVGNQPTSSYGNVNAPDIVGNLRVEQAWGAAQLMGALHQVRATYYGTTANGAVTNGHPNDEWGWVIGAGARIKLDQITPGSYFQGQIHYTEGAVRYLAHTPFGTTSSYARFDSGPVGTLGDLGLGWVMDGMYTGATAPAGTSIQLTKGWGFNASYEHVWNPKWRTSVYGGFMAINYNSIASAAICAQPANAATASATALGTGNVGSYTGACNPDWSTWWIGSRTQWNITPAFYLGVDVLYTRLNSMSGSTVALGAAALSRPAGTYALADQDGVAVSFRAHYDFLP